MTAEFEDASEAVLERQVAIGERLVERGQRRLGRPTFGGERRPLGDVETDDDQRALTDARQRPLVIDPLARRRLDGCLDDPLPVSNASAKRSRASGTTAAVTPTPRSDTSPSHTAAARGFHWRISPSEGTSRPMPGMASRIVAGDIDDDAFVSASTAATIYTARIARRSSGSTRYLNCGRPSTVT